MSGNKITKTSILGIAACLVAFSLPCLAEEDEEAPIWVDKEYSSSYQPEEEPIKDGLHIRDTGDESMVIRAHKERKSVILKSAESESTSISPDMPDIYVVKKGDTLWDICSRFFADSYMWPKIWSYNPRITNPHWIYPGDRVRLSASAEELARPLFNAKGQQPLPEASDTRVAPRGQESIYLKNQGFVDSELIKQSGLISGSFKEALLLTQHDEIYIKFEEDSEVKIGSEYAVYKILREVDPIRDIGTDLGWLVEIQGIIRIITFDQDSGIARGLIIEAWRTIERDMKVGPIQRRFELVPPVRNRVDQEGAIVAFLDPTVLAAGQRIIFVDIGREDGVLQGNRIFVVERRDLYKRTLGEHDEDEGYPTEVIAEARVIEARPHTSTCLVTRSIRELEVGNRIEMRKGY